MPTSPPVTKTFATPPAALDLPMAHILFTGRTTLYALNGRIC